MKVLVTGVGGQLGHDVMNELAKRGYEGVGSDIAPAYAGFADGSAVTTMPYVQMDITDSVAVKSVFNRVKPDVVVHCAAWTAVDLAEDEDKQPKVRAINAKGTENIALCCKALDAKMVYISTDYVFDGQGEKPWKPDCKDYKPLNVYGQTKLEGELAVSGNLEKYFIVRIAWVFGLNGKNFIKTMLQAGGPYDERLARNHCGIRPEQGGTPLQQPPGQVKTGGSRFQAPAHMAGCSFPLPQGNWRNSRLAFDPVHSSGELDFFGYGLERAADFDSGVLRECAHAHGGACMLAVFPENLDREFACAVQYGRLLMEISGGLHEPLHLHELERFALLELCHGGGDVVQEADARGFRGLLGRKFIGDGSRVGRKIALDARELARYDDGVTEADGRNIGRKRCWALRECESQFRNLLDDIHSLSFLFSLAGDCCPCLQAGPWFKLTSS